jgi:hypothetical protein
MACIKGYTGARVLRWPRHLVVEHVGSLQRPRGVAENRSGRAPMTASDGAVDEDLVGLLQRGDQTTAETGSWARSEARSKGGVEPAGELLGLPCLPAGDAAEHVDEGQELVVRPADSVVEPPRRGSATRRLH